MIPFRDFSRWPPFDGRRGWRRTLLWRADLILDGRHCRRRIAARRAGLNGRGRGRLLRVFLDAASGLRRRSTGPLAPLSFIFRGRLIGVPSRQLDGHQAFLARPKKIALLAGLAIKHGDAVKTNTAVEPRS